MDDLVAFLGREELEPLAQAAVAHAQFETIHAFPDGNGRVGRAMVRSLLRSKRVTGNVTIPVSADLLTNLDRYFDALTEYRRGRPEPIVRLMAEASFSSIANGRALVSDLRSVRDRWSERIQARSDAAAWKVVDILMAQAVIDSPTVQERLGIPAMSANRAIERLVKDGVLKEVSGRYRDRLRGQGSPPGTRRLRRPRSPTDEDDGHPRSVSPPAARGPGSSQDHLITAVEGLDKR